MATATTATFEMPFCGLGSASPATRYFDRRTSAPPFVVGRVASVSALQMIPESDRGAGMTRLAHDLQSGEWERRFGHLAALDHFDVGYRLVVSWA
jgi:hypothetical protein